MDGIYSAAREIAESELFKDAIRLGAARVTRTRSRNCRVFCETAVKKARRHGQRVSLSPWTEFDFYVRAAVENQHPGALLPLLGLWPVKAENDSTDDLNVSQLFIDKLFSSTVAAKSTAQRIESLRLLTPSEPQLTKLGRFLRSAATRPLLDSLYELEDEPDLWINELRLEPSAQEIQGIEIVTWRNRNGGVKKPSGLIDAEDADDPPLFILDKNADQNGNYSKLEIAWKTRPDNMEKGAVEYDVSILTDMDEQVASKTLAHTAKRDEKCRFTNDDFSMLNDDALINAKIVVSVIGDDHIPKEESEEFVIKFGEPPERTTGGVGKVVRTFSEGVIELDSREAVTQFASSNDQPKVDSKGHVLLRTRQRGKSYRVLRSPLIHEMEQDWIARGGEPGRWKINVRGSGVRAGEPEFIPTPFPATANDTNKQWSRVVSASKKMAERFSYCGGGVGQVYDQMAAFFDSTVKEYLLGVRC